MCNQQIPIPYLQKSACMPMPSQKYWRYPNKPIILVLPNSQRKSFGLPYEPSRKDATLAEMVCDSWDLELLA